MKRIETILTILMLGFYATLQGGEELAWLNAYNVTWTSPSENSAGSMPVGGGDIGVNVWVENGDLLLYIDRSGNIDENDQQLKSGRVRVRLDPSPFARVPRITASGSDSGQIPNHAFDDKLGGDQKWFVKTPTAWISIEAARTWTIDEYRLTSAEDCPERDPKNWVLTGSNDGIKWKEIDRRADENFIKRNEERTFRVASPAPFLHHRLAFENHSGEWFQIGEIQLKQSGSNPLADDRRAANTVNFRQTLNLRTGRVEIEATSEAASVRGSVWVDVAKPIVHVELESKQPLTMTAAWETWRNAKHLVPRTMKADGTVDSNDFNRWSMFGYYWYDGEVFTYPDQVTHRESAVEFFHRNDNADLIFDKEVKGQGLESVKAEFAHPTRDRIFGGLLSGDGLVAAGKSEGSYSGTPFRSHLLRNTAPQTRQHLRVFLHTDQTPSLENWRAGLDKFVRESSGGDSKAWEDNQAWWKAFWNRSHIIVNSGQGPDDIGWQVGRNYQLMRYLLASNVRGEWPTRFNGGLFTFDPVHVNSRSDKDAGFYNPDYRMWGAWTQQNQRLVYWPMLKSGDFDAMLPQFAFYRKNLPAAEARTQLSWKIPGASFCEQIGSGGLPLGSHYGWEPPLGKRDPKKEMGLSDAHATYYTTALEFAYMIHEWHRFNGGDLTPYLPLLKKLVVFHFEYFPMLHERATGKKWDESGQAVFDPSHALETYRGKNSTDVLCALRRNLECLLALPESQITSEEKTQFQEWLGRLPALNFRERNGKKIIGPIAGESTRISNYELPQLYPVFPWGYYGLGQPDLQVAIDTWRYGIDPWTSGRKPSDPPFYPAREYWYGWTQQAIILARLGLTEEAKDYVTKKLADARGNNNFKSPARMRFPAFWGPGFDWTPDHNWGGSGMIALQEMALQTSGSELRVLPAWPKEWDVDFKLHAPGKTVVECVYRDGKVQSSHVIPVSRRENVLLAD